MIQNQTIHTFRIIKQLMADKILPHWQYLRLIGSIMFYYTILMQIVIFIYIVYYQDVILIYLLGIIFATNI